MPPARQQHLPGHLARHCGALEAHHCRVRRPSSCPATLHAQLVCTESTAMSTGWPRSRCSCRSRPCSCCRAVSCREAGGAGCAANPASVESAAGPLPLAGAGAACGAGCVASSCALHRSCTFVMDQIRTQLRSFQIRRVAATAVAQHLVSPPDRAAPGCRCLERLCAPAGSCRWLCCLSQAAADPVAGICAVAAPDLRR